ncbi:MAG: PQQ-binding-like beta-propeller repeat protein [Planctomycetes bacterium]|nr:PQQ-binding-like beta-propeller repeat protein [Planctomycetota bacterium]
MKKLIFLISTILFSGLAGAGQDNAALVSAELLREAGWTHNWQMNLPLKADEEVAGLRVKGSRLYAMTNTNILFCIDRKEGRVQCSSQLSASRLPVCKPVCYEDKFWFIVGSEMMVFDPNVGDFTIKEKFPQVGSSAECGLARNKEYVYISGSDNRLHAINIDGFWQQFTATADNDSPIVSVLATDDIVVFATQAGNVVGMSPNKAKKLWQYDVTGRIKGQLVLDGEDIYVGSLDSKLYKLGLSSGKLIWKSPFHSGAPIRDTFAVGTEIIYLYSPLNGLYGVNKQTGKPIWQVASGEGMICETPQKGFVFALPGIVKVMDNKSGKELYSVNFSSVQRYAVNTTDAVMYLADTKGRLMSVTVE